MVGAGIFPHSVVLQQEKQDLPLLISFVLAAIPQVLLGLCYAELASRYPRAGGS